MNAPATRPRMAAKMTFSTATRLTGRGASKRSSISRAKPRSKTNGKVTPCNAVRTMVKATMPGSSMAAKPGRANPMLGRTLPKMKRRNKGCKSTCTRKAINSRPVTTRSRRRIARNAVSAMPKRLLVCTDCVVVVVVAISVNSFQ